MDVQWTTGFAWTYFTSPDYSVVPSWIHAAFLPPDTINQTEPHVYQYTNFIKGVVGYMPLGFQNTRIVAVISFANPVLPCVLTAYPGL